MPPEELQHIKEPYMVFAKAIYGFKQDANALKTLKILLSDCFQKKNDVSDRLKKLEHRLYLNVTDLAKDKEEQMQKDLMQNANFAEFN